MKDVSVRKYDYIDALRGIAVFGVVLVHTSQWVHASSPFLFLVAKEGQVGVQLFYLASALTLFLSMGARTQRESRPLTKFFIRRFFRIAPLFYLGIVVYMIYPGGYVKYWAPNGVDWWYVPLTALFMHGWNPETINSVVPGGWSIAVEMTFYLLVPLLFVTLTTVRRTLVALFVAVLLNAWLSPMAVEFWMQYYPPNRHFLVHHFGNYWFFSQLPIFIMGIFVYHIIKATPYRDFKTGLFMLLVSLFIFTASLTAQSYENLVPRHYFYGVGFVLLVLSLHYWPNKLLVNPLTTAIGRWSFSIYLVHFMVLSGLLRLFPDGFFKLGDEGLGWALLLVMAITSAIAWFTHRFIERPGIRMGRRITEKL